MTDKPPMKAFCTCDTKSTLLQWFRTNRAPPNPQIFGANADGIKAFDCFYVDVESKVIAFRTANITKPQRLEFYNDPYERFLRRDELNMTGQSYSSKAPEPNYYVAVYEGVPFDVPLETLRDANVDDYCMECSYDCTEIKFTLDFPNAVDIMVVREERKG